MSWLRVWRAAGQVALASGALRVVVSDATEREERAGGSPDAAGAHPVWIHAASVGETVAASSLVRSIRERSPRPIALSSTTRTGRARAAALAPDFGPFHAPVDAPAAVRRALERLRPSAYIAMESELWPTLLDELARRGVPWGLASARMSERGLARRRRVRGLYAAALSGVAAVAARSEEDAERFRALGAPAARVRVTGDLKQDRAVLPWVAPPRDPSAWIAACTRPGEEELVLAALQEVRAAVPRGVLLLAPRHPERFEEVARIVARGGVPMRRWRDRAVPDGSAWSVVLVDEMGVLDEAYRRASVAFLGGSLVPLRGHSPWEAAAAGRGVLVGPNVESCREDVAALAAAGGALTVPDADALAARVRALLADAEGAERMGRNALAALRARGGAGDATLQWFLERGVLR